MALLIAKSNSELEKDAERAAEAERADKESLEPKMQGIVSHIRSAYLAALHHKDQYITQRLIQCQLQKAGEYDAETRQKLEKIGGCKDFFNISETKTDALEAWIADVTSGSGELPFAVTPTPIPTIPDDRQEAIVAEVEAAYQQSLAMGNPMSPQAVYEMAAAAFDESQNSMFETAKAAAENMEQKMRDQFEEGGWQNAFDSFIQDYTQYPAAFLKGPVMQRSKRIAWEGEEAVVKEEITPTWKAVNPFSMFPAPNAPDLNTGPVCEVYPMSPTLLQQQIGAAGWNDKQILAVLSNPMAAMFLPEQSDSASTQALIELRDETINQGTEKNSFWAVEYHGSVQGSMLKEWGLTKKKGNNEDIQDDFWYEVEAVLIGNHVVRCILNPNPLGNRPYYVASFVTVTNSVWGRSMLEKMADAQKSYNSIKRNMMNALAEAARPQTVVDVDLLAEGCGVASYPGKVWRYKGNTMSGQATGRKPVDFFQFNPSVNNYQKALQAEEENADNRTLVPRYVHGNENIGGAGNTATGLAMLMSSSHKGIKRSLGNIDRGVIKPCAQSLYNHNLLYLPNQKYRHLKGDCQIQARGALYLLVKEQVVARQEQFLSATNNPTDMQIIGIEGRAEVLRAIAKTLQMEHEDIVPDRNELVRRAQQILAQQHSIQNDMAQVPQAPNMDGAPAEGPLDISTTGPGQAGPDNPPQMNIPEGQM